MSVPLEELLVAVSLCVLNIKSSPVHTCKR